MEDSRALLPEAEDDIRRHITRHYDQVVEIERLRSEVEHWRVRATSAEREAALTTTHLVQIEEKKDQLLATIAMLKAQFDVGAQCWLNGYEALRNIDSRMFQQRRQLPPGAGPMRDEKVPPVASPGGTGSVLQSGEPQHSGEGNGQQDGRRADREDRQAFGSGDVQHRPVPGGADDVGGRPEPEHNGA